MMSPSCKARASDDNDDDDDDVDDVVIVASGRDIDTWVVVSLDVEDDSDGNDQRRCSTW